MEDLGPGGCSDGGTEEQLEEKDVSNTHSFDQTQVTAYTQASTRYPRRRTIIPTRTARELPGGAEQKATHWQKQKLR